MNQLSEKTGKFVNQLPRFYVRRHYTWRGGACNSVDALTTIVQSYQRHGQRYRVHRKQVGDSSNASNKMEKIDMKEHR